MTSLDKPGGSGDPGDPGALDDPQRLRVSDAERHDVAERLREAAGEGRIDLEELDERLEATYAARTYADLVPITSDLPGTPGAASTPSVPLDPDASTVVPLRPDEDQRTRHLAVLSGVDRKGVWTMPPEMTVTCFMGGADLDLREARFGAREVVLHINAVMGGANVIVGPDVVVHLEGTGIMGGYSGPEDPDPDDVSAESPVLRVRGVAIWGGVSVERKERRDRKGRNGPELPPGRGPHQLH